MNLKFIQKLSFLAILFSLFAVTVNATVVQNADIALELVPSGGMVPCEVANSVETINVSTKNKNLDNVQITLTLPPGIEYVSGTVTGGYTEDVSSTPTVPVFNLGSLASFASVNFDITRTAKCAAVQHALAAGIFKDAFSTSYTIAAGGSGASPLVDTDESINPYLINYGNLVMSNIASQVANVGDQIANRDVSVVNGGNGCIESFTHFVRIDTNSLSDYELRYNGTLLTPSATNLDTLFYEIDFSLPLFNAIVGPCFDGAETFTFQETFTVTGCAQVPVRHRSFWGCNIGEVCQMAGSQPGSLTYGTAVPNVTMVRNSTAGLELCGPKTFTHTVTNTATAAGSAAIDVLVNLGLGQNASLFTTHSHNPFWAYDNTPIGTTNSARRNITNFMVNGVPTDTSLWISSIYANNYSTVLIKDLIPTTGPDPDGVGVGLEDLDGDGFYDDLLPGGSFTFSYDIELVNIPNTCSSSGYVQYLSWEHCDADVSFLNQCEVQRPSLRNDVSYQNLISQYNTTNEFTAPTDVADGDTFMISIIPKLYSGGLKCGSDVTGSAASNTLMTLTIPLPVGIIWDGDQPDFNGDNMMSGVIDTMYQVGQDLIYETNRAGNDYSDLYKFKLRLDCSLYTGSNILALPITANWTCGGGCFSKDFYCGNFPSITMQCPGPCRGPVAFGMDARRTTAGWTDNTMTTKVDLSTYAEEDLDTYLVKDTMMVETYTYISDTTMDNLWIDLFYSGPFAAANPVIEYVDATYTTIDFNTGLTTTGSITTVPVFSGTSTKNYRFDISEAVPASGNFEATDSIWFNARFVFRDDLNTASTSTYHQIMSLFRFRPFAMSSTMVPHACNTWGDQVTVTQDQGYLTGGYNITPGGSNSIVRCTPESLLAGHMRTFNSGGDINPGEFRPFFTQDSQVIILPEFIEFTGNATFNGYTGSLGNPAGDILVEYDVPSRTVYLSVNPSGNYKHRDQGTGHSITQLSTVAQCGLDANVVQYVRSTIYATKFAYSSTPEPWVVSNIPGVTSDHTASATVMPVGFIAPIFNMQSPNPIAQGSDQQISWDVDITNQSGVMDFNFVRIEEVAGITITDVQLVSSGASLSTTSLGGFTYAEMGTIAASSSESVRIFADFTACEDVDLDVDHGWTCSGFPVDYANVDAANCYINSVNLELIARPAKLQFDSIVNPITPLTMCNPFDMELWISSTDAGNVSDPFMTFTVPGGSGALTITDDSVSVEYPFGSGNFDNVSVSYVGPTVVINLMEHISIDTIGGIYGVDNNIGEPGRQVRVVINAQTECSFVANSALKFRAFGNSPCGAPVDVVSAITTELSVAGASTDYEMINALDVGDGSQGCNAYDTIFVESTVFSTTGGVTDAAAQAKITLPENINYAGIFTCTSVDCPVFVSSTVVSGKEELLFDIPALLPSTTVLEYYVIVQSTNEGCSVISEVELSTFTEIGGVTCNAGVCPAILVETGNAREDFALEKPAIAVEVPTSNAQAIFNPGTNEYSILLEIMNSSTIDMASGYNYSVYCADILGNSTGPAIGTGITSQTVPAMTTIFETLDFVNTTTACSVTEGLVIEFLPSASNCQCEPFSFVIPLTEVEAIVGLDDADTTMINTPVMIDILTNDTSFTSTFDTSAIVTTTPSVLGGTTSIDPATGLVTYTPPTNFTGLDSFEYTVCAVEFPMDCETQTVTVYVEPNPIVAVDDADTTPEDTPVTVNALTNDTSVTGIDNASIAIIPGTETMNGTTVNNGDGTFTYTPNPNFSGVDSFDYVVCDNTVLTPTCDTATVVITITPVNDPPVIVEDPKTTPEDVPVDVCPAVSDVDDATNTLVLSTCTPAASNGTVTGPDAMGCFEYTPNSNFNGLDSVCTIVCDPMGLCDTVYNVIDVTPINDAPIALNDTASTQEDTDTLFNITTFTDPSTTPGDDSDVDGNIDNTSIDLDLNGLPGPQDTYNNGDGTFMVDAAGNLTFSPNPGFNGVTSIDYSVCDDGTPLPALCDTATIVITVESVNDAPVITPDPQTTPEETPVTVCPTYSDADDATNTLIFSTCTPFGSNGMVAGPDAMGCYVYTPNADFNGLDSICTIVCDPSGACDTTINVITVTPVNDTPTIMQPPVVTPEDTPIVICPTIDDVDDANTTLTLALCGGPMHGTATPTGTIPPCYTYTPDAGYNGPDTVCILVCDPAGACSEVEVPITVTPVNDPPMAVDDAETTDEDVPVDVDVLGNDSDSDTTLNPASVIVIDAPSNGTTSTDPLTGITTYTPNPEWNGIDTFTYVVCDFGIPMPPMCDTADVIITIDPVNDTPTIVQPPVVTPEDTPIVICPTVDDIDDNNMTLAVTICDNPDNGTMSPVVGQPQCYEYTPNPNYNGPDTVCLMVCDDDGACSEVEVPITVTSLNDAPVAVDDFETTDEEVPVTIDILDNDIEVDTFLDPTTVVIVEPTDSGSLTINTVTGEVTYTPNPNFTGMDTFTYSVCDYGTPVLCDTADVIITVLPVNDTPTIMQPPVVTPEDTPIVICPMVDDIDDVNSTLTVTICDAPDNGSLASIPGQPQCYEYTPDANFNGMDTVCFTVCDDEGACSDVEVPITVTPVNNPPVAADDAETTDEEVPVVVDVLDNDMDTDTTLNPASVLEIDAPSNGTTSVNAITGEITYTPFMDFTGMDTFSYVVCDFGIPMPEMCDTADVIITIDPVNDTPTIVQPPVVTPEDTPIVICPTVSDVEDVDGALAITICGSPDNGTMSPVVGQPQCYEYTPDPNYNGPDTVCFTVCDSEGACMDVEVPITVVPLNDAPIAVDDFETTDEDMPVDIDILVNDIEVDTAFDTTSVMVITPTDSGTVTITDGVATYTPNPNFTGTDTFTYVVCDLGLPAPGLCDTAEVVITIDPVNDTPTIAQPPVVIPEDSFIVICPMVDDIDDVNGSLSVTICDGPDNGSLASVPGSPQCYEYTPDANFNGMDTVCFTVCDDDGACSEVEIPITVTPVNDQPTAVDDSETTDEDTPVTVVVMPNDSDVDTTLNPASVMVIDAPSNGTAVPNAAGEIVYTPTTPNFTGMDTFTYVVCDFGIPMPEMCDTAEVIITIDPVNDAPMAVNDTSSTLEDTPVTFPITSNDNDDLDPLGNIDDFTVDLDPNSPGTQTVFSTPNGTYTTDLVGNVTFTPNPMWNGMDSTPYVVCDDGNPLPALCDTAMIYVTVDPVNDGPEVNDDAGTTPEDTNIDIDVVANDTDSDSTINPMSVTIVDSTSNGTLSVDPITGVVTFDPDTNFNGMDTFTYYVCDNGTPLPVLCDTAEVIITVTPVNDPPIAVNDIDTTNEDTPVTFQVVVTNDTDVESVLDPNIDLDPSTPGVQSSWTTPNGTYMNDGNGNVTFTPVADWNGIDSIPYVVCDQGTPMPALCDTAIITVVVLPMNDEPTAVDDVETTDEDMQVPVDVVANDNDDVDPLGNIDSATVTIITPPMNGMVDSISTEGIVYFTPDSNFNGIDSFEYSVCDDGNPLPAMCDTAWAVITIDPVQDNPFINDDVDMTDEDMPVVVDVIANDNDSIDGSPIDPTTVDTTGVTAPMNGTITNIDPVTGEIEYTPNPNFNGVDSFEYVVCDSGIPVPVVCDTAWVVITVNPVNDPPVAVNDSAVVPEDSTTMIDLVGNDSDPLDSLGNIDSSSVVVITPPVNGVVTIDSNGMASYTPNPNFNGVDSFQYTVCDDGNPLPALCDTAWVFITIDPVNDEPQATDDSDVTIQDVPVDIDVTNINLDTDSLDPLGNIDPTSVEEVTAPMNGSTEVDSVTGVVTYTPDPGFFGVDSFQYVVCDDGFGQPIPLCDTAWVVITVLQDTDGDGVPNNPNPWYQDDIDDDNDGILDTEEGEDVDTDDDGIVNSLDLDSDGDGIPDNVEAQSTEGYINPTYNDDGTIVDVDGDGLNDVYDNDIDSDNVLNSDGLTVEDTDGDDTPDYLDTDSDNDSVLDEIEGNDADHDGVADIVASGIDDDMDGLDDAFDANTDGYNDPNGIMVNDNPVTDLPDTDGTEDVDYRDTDDDGDGVPTSVEVTMYEDCDNDGLPNYLDMDLCMPIIPEGISPNGDGMNDAWVIEGLEYMPDNTVWIFNRWGHKVYEAEGYKNDWRGTNNFGVAIANENLPEGTYFYILESGIEGVDPFKGFIYVTR